MLVSKMDDFMFGSAKLGSTLLLVLFLGLMLLPQRMQAQNKGGRSSNPTAKKDQVDRAKEKESQLRLQLEKAKTNRVELERAIQSAPRAHRSAIEFLISNMPTHDLQNLSSDFLLDNVRLAFEARQQAAWQIPDDIFLNDVLPYANIDEPRDPWREELTRLCRPLIEGCQTPSEAAQRLNEKVFKKLGVKYSTARRRANQSPRESMDQGLASCTGLSIILADACRSVGVPARLAGIPSWKNKRGNHTWVEVWDQQWHFTGAAEPSAQGLNHTWFQNDAALADPNSKLHSIYAVSFRQTPTEFPMVWSPEKRVFAENVTRRYLPAANKKSAADTVPVMFRVWNADKSERVVAEVFVNIIGTDQVAQQGKSRNNTADMNDMLVLELKPSSEYVIRVSAENVALETNLKTGTEPNQVVEIILKPRN